MLFSGGLILGAFYMATDYVTGPSVRSAQIVFGIACGILTVLIRLKGGYPEGVMFAILILNAFVPIINRVRATIAQGASVTWDAPTIDMILPAMQPAVAYRPAILEGVAFDLEEIW